MSNVICNSANFCYGLRISLKGNAYSRCRNMQDPIRHYILYTEKALWKRYLIFLGYLSLVLRHLAHRPIGLYYTTLWQNIIFHINILPSDVIDLFLLLFHNFSDVFQLTTFIPSLGKVRDFKWKFGNGIWMNV